MALRPNISFYFFFNADLSDWNSMLTEPNYCEYVDGAELAVLGVELLFILFF